MISNIQFQEQLEQEIQKLTELEKRLRNRLATAPEGTLHIHRMGKGKYSQYYTYREGKQIYLPVKKKDFALALAQKEYDEKILTVIEARLKSAKQLLKKYKVSLGDLYVKLSDERKELITPIAPTDEMSVEDWYEKHPEIMQMSMKESILFVKENGGLTVQAHPYRRDGYIDHVRLFAEYCDGLEVYNANRREVENSLANTLADAYGLIKMFYGNNIPFF